MAGLLIVVTCDLGPDCPLADEDKEDEEASENVEDVNCSEDNL